MRINKHKESMFHKSMKNCIWKWRFTVCNVHFSKSCHREGKKLHSLFFLLF